MDRDFIMDNSEDDTYTESQKNKRPPLNKRRKINVKRAPKVERKPEPHVESVVSLQPLLDLVEWHDAEEPGPSFELLMDALLPEFLHDREEAQVRESEIDVYGQSLRPLTRFEALSLVESNPQGDHPSVYQNIALRKLKLRRQRGLAGISEPNIFASPSQSVALNPLPRPRETPPVNPAVLDALQSIKTTPYSNSFASRMYGSVHEEMNGKSIGVDWHTRSPWMELMTDIKDHYSFAHPDRDQAVDSIAPITYGCLQPHHLLQVHDLLARVFWTGIDVTDSLQYSPEKSTVIATYKHLVVGVAILSSPQETYITYLAVRAGWDNSQIATSMLYHLIQLNPNKDITLHVSANNPAMLLYNRFGFKAEEFVAGFYQDYLDPQSRASKNAFRLRLRR